MSVSSAPPAPSRSAAAPSPAARALRVLYVWDADYPWDVRVEKICATLTAAGHDVHIVARNRKWRAETERLPEGTVHRMPRWRAIGQRADDALGFPAFFSPRWSRLIERTAREVRADLIIVRDVPLCPTAIRVGHRLGIPVMSDMAENYPAMTQKFWDAGLQRPTDYLVRNPKAVAAVERWCLKRLDHVVVVIDEMVDRMRALGVPADRLTLVSNTPPRARAEQAAPALAPESGAPMDVVYLGLLEVPRGVGDLIGAVAILRGEGAAVRLRLVGAGRDAERFKAQALSLGLGADAVEFLGFVPRHEDALAIVAAAHVGAVPNYDCEHYNTSIPNKLFDYMAAGLPVLASSAVPIARIVRDSAAGEVFVSRDAASCADAMRRLLDPARRRAEGEAGRRAVLAHYNWERDADALLAAVGRVADAGVRR